MYQLYRDRPLLVLCLVLANIVLSAWCFYIDPVLNNDGVTYLAIAQLMLDGEWTRAFDYYSWPYYSVFIAAVAKIFWVDVEMAAYILNTLLVTSLTLAFVCIVADLSNNNRRVILIAMLVILLFPSISKYRSFIIRDFGYLSCYLWSLYFIFRFCTTQRKGHLIGWLCFAALSCLFRFEGIAFLLIAPYFLLSFSAHRMPHRRAILTALSLFIVTTSISLLIWYINDKYAAVIEMAQAAGKDIHNVFDLFVANAEQKLDGQALTPLSYLGVISGNIGDVAYELIRRMAIFYFLFAVYAFARNLVFTSGLIKRIWLVYVVTNFIVLIGFSLYNNFLVSRYTMATALTLLILAPFVIDRLLLAFKNISLTKRIVSVIAISMLTLASLEGLDVRTKKNHVKQAGSWMKENISQDALVYSNDRLLAYYWQDDVAANIDDNYSNLQLRAYMDSDHINTFEYIALSVNPKSKLEEDYRQTLWFRYGRPIQIVQGIEGRAVYVYQLKKD